MLNEKLLVVIHKHHIPSYPFQPPVWNWLVDANLDSNLVNFAFITLRAWVWSILRPSLYQTLLIFKSATSNIILFMEIIHHSSMTPFWKWWFFWKMMWFSRNAISCRIPSFNPNILIVDSCQIFSNHWLRRLNKWVWGVKVRVSESEWEMEKGGGFKRP